ncbi:MAG: Rrf2 family transcriptional regulator [Clostridiales bacterium]|nr:Rrf2 family transcriptional regulator [Bacillota bacterium]NLK03035.1 Rrf2 family transcriptional regulator [Clostridiales bacterium]
MKVSTKGRYGLRAMIDLSLYSKNELVPLASIAERQDISKSYLEQVFSALRKAGLVKSIKGAQGGYSLSTGPEDITVGMILRALEGDLSVVPMEDGVISNRIESYIRENVWNKIDDKVFAFVNKLTLKDITDDYLKKDSSPMYYI